jgi:ferredoxin-type protein NapH
MSLLTYRNLDRTRRGVQLLVVLFLIAVPVLNWLGVQWVLGTLYSMSIGGLDIADPAMALQTVLLTGELFLPLLLAALLPVVLALALGRVFCSWACPFNTLHEWAAAGRRRLRKLLPEPLRSARWLVEPAPRGAAAGNGGPPRNPRPWVYWSVYAGLLVAVLVVGLPLLAWLSAPGILSSQLSQAILGMGVGLELGLVALLLVVELSLARRFWCKYLCPVGATLALCHTRRTLHVARTEERCGCKAGGEACRHACPLGLLPAEAGALPYCFNCGVCIAACEKTRRGALHFSFAADVPAPPRSAPASRRGLVTIEVPASLPEMEVR